MLVTVTKHHTFCNLALLAAILLLSVHANGRSAMQKEKPGSFTSQSAIYPPYCVAAHSIGEISLTFTNTGLIGPGYLPDLDCYLGNRYVLSGCEYPAKSRLTYLFNASLWLGGVVGSDTLVSSGLGGGGQIGWELNVSTPGFRFRSTLDPEAPEFVGAISEEDYESVYADTLLGTTYDYFMSRPHKPLNLMIRQKSFAWSYPYAEDFVLFDLEIKNIGNKTIDPFYVGIYCDGDVTFSFNPDATDDLCGFLTSFPSDVGCAHIDTVNIAWTADNDGDPYEGEFIKNIFWPDKKGGPGEGDPPPEKSITNVVGLRVLKKPTDYASFSFNWWRSDWTTTFDFGPRHRENFRDFRTGGLGEPQGDVNKYYMMSNGEIDYDPAYIAKIYPGDPVWLYPSRSSVTDISTGFDARYVLSYGPMTLPPGSSVPFVFAFVAGENFHTDVNNLRNLPDNPDAYYNNLDFSDLVKNSNWAARIFDNPGVDTDGDGYFGKSRICVYDSVATESGWVAISADTVFYEGDGIPDWKAAGPPPAPLVWVEPEVNGLRVRFNGSRSETEKDLFTNIADFEGYHIWLGRDEREESYSLVASYDLENYDKYVWNQGLYPEPEFELKNRPFSRQQLRCLYGDRDDPCADSAFDPMDYTRGKPYYLYRFPDSTFYFATHNFNAFDPGRTTAIAKVYPDAPKPPPGVHPDSLDETYYTDDGYLKYYEYQFFIDNLLATVSYWVSVTCYDFGSPESGLYPLETKKTVGAKFAYPLTTDNDLYGDESPIYVYPNPYRIDASYRSSGFEGRTMGHLPNNKVRAVNFMNLPPKCTIRIFSLDGDLVRQIDHDKEPSAPDVRHNEWNLVTQNRQLVVSGIYYWSVEAEDGSTQMGKLVILM